MWEPNIQYFTQESVMTKETQKPLTLNFWENPATTVADRQGLYRVTSVNPHNTFQ